LSIYGSNISGNSLPIVIGEGGGIYTDGVTTITASTISNNQSSVDSSVGGGIYLASASLTLTNSAVQDNEVLGLNSEGGGIAASAPRTCVTCSTSLTVSDSTLSGNSASHAGGIYSAGNLAVANSTVAASQGGGIEFDLSGETPVNTGSIANATVSNNVGGGISCRERASLLPGTRHSESGKAGAKSQQSGP
jgi:hypothetical protein